MRLIVGLGNPGAKYEYTRHNVGFNVVDELARRFGVRFHGVGKAPYLEAEAELETGPVTLLKPQTYMNRSGGAVNAWMRINRIERDDLDKGSEEIPFVICDDLALPLGSLRMRARGSAGGQKGLESIIKIMSGLDVPRLRLGIAGGDGVIPPEEWSDYVLDRVPEAELKQLDELTGLAADVMQRMLEHGLEDAASRFNRRIRPEV